MATGEADVTIDRPGADVRSHGRRPATARRGAEAREADGRLDACRVRGGGSPSAARLPGAGGETLDCGNSGHQRCGCSRVPSPAGPRRRTLVGDASLSPTADGARRGAAAADGRRGRDHRRPRARCASRARDRCARCDARAPGRERPGPGRASRSRRSPPTARPRITVAGPDARPHRAACSAGWAPRSTATA